MGTAQPIRVLPAEVASQIAAGEVIERPASVVKELIENALDAGANLISVTIEGAGQRLIEVADDGCGIPAEELALAVERHATSKLTSASDLFHIRTLGFRGEALASIGSVARLTITSRTAQSDAGARLRVEGGIAGPLQQIGAPVGSLIRVEDLFFNVPARLKFLKTAITERRQIDTLVTRYALAYPQVRFHLRQEGNISLQTSGNGKRREVLAALYGADVARQMLEMIAEEDLMSVQGFISPVAVTRSHRRDMTFFINGRPVQDAALSAALLKGYHTLLMVGRYPVAILFIQMPPEAVDVNVHPTKAEVRFQDSERIFGGIQNAVRRALLAHSPAPGLSLGGQPRWTPGPAEFGAQSARPSPWSASARPEDPAWNRMDYSRPEPPAEDQTASPGAGFAAFQGQEASATAASQPGLPGALTSHPTRPPILRLLGQVANTYLIAEGPDGLYLIDQHAAHERILFERLNSQRGASALAQTLLQPATVDLPPASARLIADQINILSSVGFQIEAFGPHTFLVRAIPALLAGSDPAAALRVLIEDFEEDETPLQAETEARIIARVCKRAAVKAGQTLSIEEQRALLHDLEACQSPRTCPHGRPTMIHLSVDLLERQFGRRGAR